MIGAQVAESNLTQLVAHVAWNCGYIQRAIVVEKLSLEAFS